MYTLKEAKNAIQSKKNLTHKLPQIYPNQLDHPVHAMRLSGALAKLTNEQVDNIVYALREAGHASHLQKNLLSELPQIYPEQLDHVIHALHLSGGLAQLTSQQVDNITYALQESGHLKHLKDSDKIAYHQNSELPTLFHITHKKAGSQWIYRILIKCCYNNIVVPKVGMTQFLEEKVSLGKVYPTLYITYEEFCHKKLPSKWKRFVIIRDLRDTLISAYFSFKISHPLMDQHGIELRKKLNALNLEEGLIFLINNDLVNTAKIQDSWAKTQEPLIRYEQLLEDDISLLTPIIKDCCPLPEDTIKEIILANRFEAIANGRKPGQENLNAHERKGIVGDWKNYFSERVKKEFKNKYADLLIRTGYECNRNW